VIPYDFERRHHKRRTLILHCFADYGTESEVLSDFGNVIRVGIDPKDTNESTPIKADAHIEDKEWDLPIKDDVTFDPDCSTRFAHGGRRRRASPVIPTNTRT